MNGFTTNAVRSFFALALAAAPALCGSAHAQNRVTSVDSELLLTNPMVVVTASKSAQRVIDVPAAVTVFTADDIRAMGAATLIDVLRYAPGVDVFETNKATANVSIRGFNFLNANKLLVMIDGRSIYQDFAGGVEWPNEPILISRIKRIEIVRGPGSALYGANAFDGVINIITYTPSEFAAANKTPALRASVGEQGSILTELTSALTIKKNTSLFVGLGYRRTDGFGERKPGQVHDSYTAPTVQLSVESKLKRGSLQFEYGNTESTSDFSNGFVFLNANWHNSYVVGSYSERGVKDPLLVRAYANLEYTTEPGIRQINQSTYDIEAQRQTKLSTTHDLVYGIDFRSTDVQTALAQSKPVSHQLFAAYIQDNIRLNRSSQLFAGLRLDQDSLFGVNVTPRLSLVTHPGHDQTLRVSFGTAFHNPTIIDADIKLALPIAPGVSETVSGNEHLKPESTDSFEIGYRRDGRSGYWAINGYYNHVYDQLVYAPTAFAPSPPFPPYTPIAIMRANGIGAYALGFEIESEIRISSASHLVANYAYEHVRNDDGTEINLTPENKLNLGLQQKLAKRWDSYLGMHFADTNKYFLSGAPLPIPAYVRWDARIGYQFGCTGHPWRVSLSATNLFDTRYYEFPLTTLPSLGATRQRRTVYMTLEGKF